MATPLLERTCSRVRSNPVSLAVRFVLESRNPHERKQRWDERPPGHPFRVTPGTLALTAMEEMDEPSE